MKKSTVILALILMFTVLLAACASTPKEYTVSFEWEGVPSIKVKSGEKVTKPDVTRDGYEATWYLDEGLNIEYDFDAPVRRSLRLWVKWEKVEFTVTFAGADIAPVKVKKGERVDRPELNRPGYSCRWMVGDREYDFSAPVTEDLTLTLELVKEEYTVRFYDGAGRLVRVVKAEYGDSVDASDLKPLHRYPDFFTFSGWDRDLDNIVGDTDVHAEYSYNMIPEKLFEFIPNGDSYKIKFTDEQAAFNGVDLSGCMGLPYEHDGKPVTAIAALAFDGNSALDSLDKLFVPSSYRIIENQAFRYCSAGEVVIAGAEEIWGYAFQYLNSESLSLPSTLTYIEPFAFNDCRAKVELEDGESYIQYNGDIYTADKRTLVHVDLTEEPEHYTFIEEVENIYPMLFDYALSLTSVTFKGNIDTIPTGLFSMCDSLTSVVFEGTVRAIVGYGEVNYTLKCGLPCPSYEPFEGCFNIRNFVLPSGLERIGDFALEDVSIKQLTLGAELESVGLGAFNASELVSVTVDAKNESYRTIGDFALVKKGTNGDKMLFFAGKNKRTTVSESDLEGITEFEKLCFNEATDLVSLSLPDGVGAIPELFVYGAKKLEKISIPASVTSIADSSAVRWSDGILSGATISSEALTTIDWRGGCGIKSFPTGSFAGIFKVFTVPSSVTKMGTDAISSVSTLNELSYQVESGNKNFVAIGGSLYKKSGKELSLIAGARGREFGTYAPTKEQLGDYTLTSVEPNAFAYNYMLGTVILPEGVTQIGQMAFYNCIGLKEVVLPASLKTLGALCFYGASGIDARTVEMYPELSGFESEGLNKVTFLGDPPTMEYEPMRGYRVFDCAYSQGGTTVVAPMPCTKFSVPSDKAEAYFEALYRYGGPEYSKKLDTEGLDTYVYVFVTGDGSAIEPIRGQYALYDMPVTYGEDGRYFVGWFTKDGKDGDWGDEITFYSPFRGTPDEDGEVKLYAKWSADRRVDGTQRIFAYELNGKTRCKLGSGEDVFYWFRFVPSASGTYNLMFDLGNVAYEIGAYRYDEVTDTMTTVRYGYDGFEFERGKTYYFYAKFGFTVYSDDGKPIGKLDSETEYEFYAERYIEEDPFGF